MKTRIIADSSADLMNKEKEQVTLVPLSITFDEEEYKDGVTIDHKTFYEKLIESDVLPTTSQVAPFDFAEKFKEVQEAYDVLSDEQKRKTYDQFGSVAFDNNAGGNPYGSYGNYGGFNTSGFGFDDININLDDMFND